MRTKNERADQVLELFEAYYERVYIFARGSVSQNEAEDIAQEVFMRLMKHPRLDSMNVNVSYLIKIAHNLIKHGYGQKQRFQQYLEGKPDFMYEDRFDRASCQERGSETKNLDMALSSLNVDERDAVLMTICQGMSYEEVARSLGVPVSTINNWKHRGLRKLQEFFAEGRGEPAPTFSDYADRFMGDDGGSIEEQGSISSHPEAMPSEEDGPTLSVMPVVHTWPESRSMDGWKRIS